MLPKKNNCLNEIFKKKKPLIGTVHCLPFPGSPEYKNEDIDIIINNAIEETIKYEKGGMDGVILENAWDVPFLKDEDIDYETVSTMTAIVTKVKEITKMPIGIVINWNAVKASLAVAKATNADFIRANQWVNAYISNSGYVEGKSGKLKRYQKNIGAEKVKVLADVQVKHGSHAIVGDRPLSEQVDDLVFYAADSIIVTGEKTGGKVDLSKLKLVKNKTNLPVLIGSGLNVEDAGEFMKYADGAIVGSSLKKNGEWWNGVEIERVKILVDKVDKLR
ncbi:MAG: BtpA/SgcQ family protein [Bacillota bacterium]